MLINSIRQEIGHKESDMDILEIEFHEMSGELFILTHDRPEKSAVIGKGGWVAGRLKEELGIDSVHVEAYSDYLVPVYRMELAIKKLEKIIETYDFNTEKNLSKPLLNLSELLKARIKYPYNLEQNLKKFNNINESDEVVTVVALSGGVDSSSSLIIAKILGFNPLAVTVNPGDIILPRYFRDNVEELTRKLKIEHKYLPADLNEVIQDSLNGRIHPCGRCSKIIEETVLNYCREIDVPYVVYGDLLSTGKLSIVQEGGLLRINLPALLSLKKGDLKKLAGHWGVDSRGGYGCPLLNEVHKKHPHMRRYSIQRVLRETRAGALEPGEALDLIMKFPMDP